MRSALGLTVLGCVLTGLVVAAWAQEPKEGGAKETVFRARLPAYYGDIVSEEQKGQIYTVQEKYHKQIAPLLKQVAELEKTRDAEIRGVLDTAQKAKLDAAIAAAKKKRELVSKLTPAQRRAAQEAARKAFEEAVRKAAGNTEE